MSLLPVYKEALFSASIPMAIPRGENGAVSLLCLRGTRSILSTPRRRAMVGAIGLGYALIAMVVGGMLYVSLSPLTLGWFFYIYPKGAGPSWAYPAILAGGPHFFLDLPLFSGVLMTLTAAGIGLGMALGALLALQLVRRRREMASGPTAAASVAGLTPALLGLVTLGACCSTVAAATAGIGLVAQSTGTTPAEAVANAWYLGVFQVVVVYVALVGQEQLLRIYGSSLGTRASPWVLPESPKGIRSAFDWRAAASLLLRMALVVAGVTWSLAILTLGFGTSGGDIGVVAWVGGLLQHVVPGVFAVLVALFPSEVRHFLMRAEPAWVRHGFRGILVASGIALLAWIPPPWGSSGASGLCNEILGSLGVSSRWGGVAPPIAGPEALLLRWAFQFALLGSFSVAAGIFPDATLRFVASRGSEADPAQRPSPWHESSESVSNGA